MQGPRLVLRASEGLRWRGASNNLPERVRTADAPPGRAGQGKEEGTQETRPQETWRQGQHPEAGPLVDGGIEKVRDPRNSTEAKKFKVFGMGLEGEGAAKATAIKTSWTD